MKGSERDFSRRSFLKGAGALCAGGAVAAFGGAGIANAVEVVDPKEMPLLAT